MVSSSHVGDAISVRWEEACATHTDATARMVRARSGGLATMMIPVDDHLSIRPRKQGRADHARYACGVDWPRQTAPRPT